MFLSLQYFECNVDCDILVFVYVSGCPWQFIRGLQSWWGRSSWRGCPQSQSAGQDGSWPRLWHRFALRWVMTSVRFFCLTPSYFNECDMFFLMMFTWMTSASFCLVESHINEWSHICLTVLTLMTRHHFALWWVFTPNNCKWFFFLLRIHDGDDSADDKRIFLRFYNASD